jgi:D-arabinose 1-dehydrogenase-like Zn-dependent alcohol dehydrogenase
MRASVLCAIGQPLAMRDMPIPEPGPGEVLVQTKACGICGTDLHMVEGWGYTPALPFIMGHEPAGIVADVGAGVQQFKPGERVVPNIFYSCGVCLYCRTNRETQCTNLGGILGVLNHHGGYGEYFTIPERQLFRLPDTVGFEEGSVVADAVVTANHAVKRGRVAQGETVLVISTGGCASAAIQIAKAYGARVITAVLNDAKAARARELGADDVVNMSELGKADLGSAVKDLTGGLGVQCVIDAVGSEQTLRDSVNALCRGGRLVILGYTQDRYPLDPRQMAVNELEIIGTRSGGRQDTAEALQHVARHNWVPIVSDRFPIEAANEALAFMRTGQAAGRIVLLHN